MKLSRGQRVKIKWASRTISVTVSDAWKQDGVWRYEGVASTMIHRFYLRDVIKK